MQQKRAGQGRNKQERAAFLKARALADADLLEALHGLRALRAPYDAVLAEIIGETLRKHPPIPDRPIVEIGAGTGQLRRWLPNEIRERCLHTDPSNQALDVLRQREPEARTTVASAHNLPFGDGACGGVLALCVFDTLQAAGTEEVAVAEIARVLATGGHFVHFLDMATLLENPFKQFQQQGVVPIPNVFGDPDDHEWPLDMVLFERDWLSQILHFALKIEHPLVTMFGPYFGAFLLQPFDLKEAIRHFKVVATNSALQQSLALQMASAIQLAVQQGYPTKSAIPFHSGQYLSGVMQDVFTKSGLFRVEFSGIVARALWRPLATDMTTRYRSLCLGHERISDRFPKRLLVPASRPDLDSGDAQTRRELIEAGVFVFVAVRV